jgi:hypothetical protein
MNVARFSGSQSVLPERYLCVAAIEHYMKFMAREHPYAGASYRVITQENSTYGVEVIVPGSYPALVTSFATEEIAEAWITDHRPGNGEGPSTVYACKRAENLTRPGGRGAFVAPDPLRGRGALLHDLSQPESRRREDAWAPVNAGLDDLGNWRKFMPQRFVSSSARTVRSWHSREASAIRSESKHCRSNNFRDPPFPQTALSTYEARLAYRQHLAHLRRCGPTECPPCSEC